MAPKPSSLHIGPGREPFVRTVLELTASVPTRDLRRIRGLRVLVEGLASQVLPETDPLSRARLRGIFAQRALLAEEGGVLSSEQVAKLLHITRQAVDKRRIEGNLLALDQSKRGYLYPAWQFEGGKVVTGFVDVLKALDGRDPWAKARFFLTSDSRLRKARPIDYLRKGRVEPVLRIAGIFEEHGAT